MELPWNFPSASREQGWCYADQTHLQMAMLSARPQRAAWAVVPWVHAICGGEWGALIRDQMGVQAPSGLLGIHTNCLAPFQPTLTRRLGPVRQRHPTSRPKIDTCTRH